MNLIVYLDIYELISFSSNNSALKITRVNCIRIDVDTLI